MKNSNEHVWPLCMWNLPSFGVRQHPSDRQAVKTVGLRCIQWPWYLLYLIGVKGYWTLHFIKEFTLQLRKPAIISPTKQTHLHPVCMDKKVVMILILVSLLLLWKLYNRKQLEGG